jgi:hypothetical protein
MDIDTLIASVRETLDGIDRTEMDEPEGGWWETNSGADLGKRKLAELEELLRKAWQSKST